MNDKSYNEYGLPKWLEFSKCKVFNKSYASTNESKISKIILAVY